MGEQPIQRRLAAVLAADVAGYTRLMEEDTDGTVAAWTAARDEVIDPTVAGHSGRVVKLTGDGFLVEFPTVQDAVKCAIALQDGLTDSSLNFRMGVNLGDIVDDGRDIHGEGVNVAARLEALADEGGICISGMVYESIRNRIDVTYEDLGDKEVKHVSAPVRVYAIRVVEDAAHADLPAPGESVIDVSAPVAGFEGRSAIAVLPFDNMSGDAEQEYFADGLAEDIITQLSIWRWFPVIARNSSFVFKGTAVDVKEIGEKLGAQYVVEGSVRRAGNKIRVTVQLIDAPTGHHIWAEKYDRDLDDIFAIQDEITQRIVGALEPTLASVAQEQAHLKHHGSLDAWEACHRGFWHYNRFKKEDFNQALMWFNKSIALDPNQPLAYGGLCLCYMGAMFRGWTDDPEQTVSDLQAAAQGAISIDERASRGHLGLGWARIFKRQFDLGIQEIERAIEVNPSFAIGHMYLGLAYIFDGRAAEAIKPLELAIRLSPNDPWYPGMLILLSKAHLMLRHIDTAVEYGERAIDRASYHPTSIMDYANALANAGRLREARREIDKLLALSPDYSVETLYWNSPFRRQEDYDFFVEGVIKAGLPEKPPASLTAAMAAGGTDKPSIAVLPFDNLSGDAEQEYFSDGITEDIIAALSRIRQFSVIARNTTFTYRGQAVDVQAIAKDLDVRYVLEGSVRKAGERVRVTAQLIDAETGNHIWADKYDRNLEDIFAVQDEITLTVVAAIEPEMADAERHRAKAKPAGSLHAWDHYQHGMSLLWDLGSHGQPHSIRAAMGKFQNAIDLDAAFAPAYANMAMGAFHLLVWGYSDDRNSDMRHGFDCARRAVELDSDDASAQMALGCMHIADEAFEPAISHLRIANEINPSDTTCHFHLAFTYVSWGKSALALPHADAVIRLNPRGPLAGAACCRKAEHYLFERDYETALATLKEAMVYGNLIIYGWVDHASILGHLGRLDEAKSALAVIAEKRPAFVSCENVVAGLAFTDPRNIAVLTEGLQKAGMPELSEPPSSD